MLSQNDVEGKKDIIVQPLMFNVSTLLVAVLFGEPRIYGGELVLS